MDGWDWVGIGIGLDLRVGGGIEHLTVLISEFLPATAAAATGEVEEHAAAKHAPSAASLLFFATLCLQGTSQTTKPTSLGLNRGEFHTSRPQRTFLGLVFKLSVFLNPHSYD